MKKNLLNLTMLLVMVVCGTLSSMAAWESYKTWDFAAIAVENGDGTHVTTDGTIKVGSTVCDVVIAPFDGIAIQGSGNVYLRVRTATQRGLFNGNSGGRTVGALDLVAGDRVVVNGDIGGCVNGTLLSQEGTTFTYEVTADGNFGVTLNRNGWLYLFDVQHNVIEAGEVYADYTIKYVDEAGVEIKDATVMNALVGTEITLAPNYFDPIYANDNKYIYVSNDAEGKTVTEEGTVVTLTFRKANVWEYRVLTSNPESVLANGTGFEGDYVKVCYPAYILKDGKFTHRAAVSNQYNVSILLNEDYVEMSLPYEDTNMDNVIYYAEAEDIAGMNVATGSTAIDRCSMGKGGYAPDDVEIYTLPAGKYKMTVSTRGGGDRNWGFQFFVGEDNVFTTGNLHGYNETFESDEFEVTAEAPLVIKAAGSNNDMVDFLFIQKTGSSSIKDAKFDAQAGKIYNLQGIEVSNPHNGIFIQNGKKVYIK